MQKELIFYVMYVLLIFILEFLFHHKCFVIKLTNYLKAIVINSMQNNNTSILHPSSESQPWPGLLNS